MGNGVRAALNEANRLHGALDKLYQMQTFDDENLLASGLVQAGFAADNPSIVCVIGHLSGRITQAALRTYVADRMAVIVPASTYDGVTAQGYGNVIRLVTKDSSEGQLMAQYLRKKIAPKTVVPVYQDGDYGADVVAGFQQQITADKIASVPVSFSWSKPDYAAAASAVLAPKPDAVLLAGNAADIGPLAPALRAAGYNGPLFGSAGMFDPVVTHKFASSLEGLVISTSMPPLALAPSDYQILSDYGQSYGAMTPLAAFSYTAAQ
ncbi:MAG: ABC transporter substrate-binding protein, partial [Stellaceae bacterium]